MSPNLENSQSVPPLTVTNTSVSSEPQRNVFPPIEFKFVKDDEFGAPRETPMPPMRNYAEPALMQEAERLDSEVAAHEEKVRELAAGPLNVQNLESQIQELLLGQEELRYELGKVRGQVTANAAEIEELKRKQWQQQPSQPMPTVSRDFRSEPPQPQVIAPPPIQQPMPSPEYAFVSLTQEAPKKQSDEQIWSNMGYSTAAGGGGVGFSSQDVFASIGSATQSVTNSVKNLVPARFR